MASPQLSSFLVYVVNEELAGRGGLIKAYTVAVDALDRPPSFDPSKSTAIRVLAIRLRRALDAIYDDDAVDIPVRITLVKGSYRPHFAPFHIAKKAVPTAPPDGAMQDPPPVAEQKAHRYLITIIVLSALLALSILYIGWDVYKQMNTVSGRADLSHHAAYRYADRSDDLVAIALAAAQSSDTRGHQNNKG